MVGQSSQLQARKLHACLEAQGSRLKWNCIVGYHGKFCNLIPLSQVKFGTNVEPYTWRDSYRLWGVSGPRPCVWCGESIRSQQLVLQCGPTYHFKSQRHVLWWALHPILNNEEVHLPLVRRRLSSPGWGHGTAYGKACINKFGAQANLPCPDEVKVMWTCEARKQKQEQKMYCTVVRLAKIILELRTITHLGGFDQSTWRHNLPKFDHVLKTRFLSATCDQVVVPTLINDSARAVRRSGKNVALFLGS